uniref:Pro-melanin concentrating hormone n=1 Tax=Hymenolepis diminuta TaxID=6216 RepID=A0A0R3SLA0_HYMDI
LIFFVYFVNSFRVNSLEPQRHHISDVDIDLTPYPYRLYKRILLEPELAEETMQEDPVVAENEFDRRSPQFAWRPHSRYGRR